MDVTFWGIHTDYALELIDWFKQYNLQYDYTKTKYGNRLTVYGITKMSVGLWSNETQIWVMMTTYDEDQIQINQHLVKCVYFE